MRAERIHLNVDSEKICVRAFILYSPILMISGSDWAFRQFKINCRSSSGRTKTPLDRILNSFAKAVSGFR